ncbi:Extended synaptotagmin-3 [Phytophthora citrophthora]|uniref:Extended synaptotagmin-3 n=1 Tax=Phytophthora citrophthora TaxID=4793 RepID=A0AAD9GPS8_9STRA|nr:Extended synaptotagmin-3 [Phytophthora citrophthora]
MTLTLGRKQRKKFIVRIVLFKCQDLAAADMDVVGGKSDPYVVFTLGGATKKSSCIMNDLNPQWSPPEKFEFEVDEWENEFLIAQVFDYDRLSKDDLIGSAVIPLTLYAGDRHCEMYSYPLVLPDEVGGIGAPKSDLFLQVSLSASDGSPVEYYY